MKFTLNRLKKDDLVQARVIEVVNKNSFIVDFNGDLTRVNNRSGRILKPNQRIELKVFSTKPLSFQLAEERQGRFDITI